MALILENGGGDGWWPDQRAILDHILSRSRHLRRQPMPQRDSADAHEATGLIPQAHRS